MGDTMESVSSDIFSGGSGKGSPLGESIGSDNESEGGYFCEMSGGESFASEYRAE